MGNVIDIRAFNAKRVRSKTELAERKYRMGLIGHQEHLKAIADLETAERYLFEGWREQELQETWDFEQS